MSRLAVFPGPWRRVCVALALLAGTAATPGQAFDERPTDGLAVEASGRNAFAMPVPTLDDGERARFAIGNSFFRRNWVQAPASPRARDGLGPHFNARACAGCHVNDGRAGPPAWRQGWTPLPAGLVLRLSVGAGPRGAPRPDPRYGEQLSPQAVPGVRPEAQPVMRWRAVHGRFFDGAPFTLQQPVYGVRALGYGPLDPQVRIGPRLAPQLAGVGLIEAVADADIESNAAAQQGRTDGIRGRVNRVWDEPSRQLRIGRFGWKANVATLAHQTAAAFRNDMGVTSGLFAEEACTHVQTDCRGMPSGSLGRSPEIDDETLGHVVFYQATLAPPARRAADPLRLEQGQRLFERARCAVCHRAAYVTGTTPFPRLSSPALVGQPIRPYTDLLVHDMGPGLADGRADFQASGRQWRTPPLWGLGLLPAVNGHQALLHDGRARGVLEAVLWHDGEARVSRDQVLRMSGPDRAALVHFVESL